MTINRSSLVLNQNYEPLNVCSWKRAFLLVHGGKAEILEDGGKRIPGIDRSFQLPSVIRLSQYVRRPEPRLRLSRREVFARDQQRCQYCGRRGSDLTLDHVRPRHRGGQHEWENLVTACHRCNHRKAGRTPREAGMTLLRNPARPPATTATMFGRYLDLYREWQPFLSGWIDRHSRKGSRRAS